MRVLLLVTCISLTAHTGAVQYEQGKKLERQYEGAEGMKKQALRRDALMKFWSGFSEDPRPNLTKHYYPYLRLARVLKEEGCRDEAKTALYMHRFLNYKNRKDGKQSKSYKGFLKRQYMKYKDLEGKKQTLGTNDVLESLMRDSSQSDKFIGVLKRAAAKGAGKECPSSKKDLNKKRNAENAIIKACKNAIMNQQRDQAKLIQLYDKDASGSDDLDLDSDTAEPNYCDPLRTAKSHKYSKPKRQNKADSIKGQLRRGYFESANVKGMDKRAFCKITGDKIEAGVLGKNQFGPDKTNDSPGQLEFNLADNLKTRGDLPRPQCRQELQIKLHEDSGGQDQSEGD